MSARIPDRHLEGLSRQSRLTVQMIALSSDNLVSGARRTQTGGVPVAEQDFESVVHQLLLQRHLVAEILENEQQQTDDDETAELESFLEDLCRAAEKAALEVQVEIAAAAGDHERATRIRDFLSRYHGLAPAAADAA